MQERHHGVLVPLDGLEIAELELGHAATLIGADQPHRDVVVAEHRREILDHLRLVETPVAGGEDRHATTRRAGRRRRAVEPVVLRQPPLGRASVITRHARVAMNPEGLLEETAEGRAPVGPVHGLGNHGDRGQSPDQAGVREQARR